MRAFSNACLAAGLLLAVCALILLISDEENSVQPLSVKGRPALHVIMETQQERMEISQPPRQEELVPHTQQTGYTPASKATIAVDHADDPVYIRIPAGGIEAPIDLSGPSNNSERFNPAAGRVDFWKEESTAKPCEAGPSYILGHGHRPGTFRNLVDDPQVADDSGIPANSEVIVTLEDGMQCFFRVIEFDLENIGYPVPGTPARRVLKDEWSATVWQETIDLTLNRPVLFLLTSGGVEFKNGHRIHADVVMAELVDVVP